MRAVEAVDAAAAKRQTQRLLHLSAALAVIASDAPQPRPRPFGASATGCGLRSARMLRCLSYNSNCECCSRALLVSITVEQMRDSDGWRRFLRCERDAWIYSYSRTLEAFIGNDSAALTQPPTRHLDVGD